MRLLPASLFGRAAVTNALTLLVFLVLVTIATVYLVFMPMANRSAEDLAAEIATAAEALPWLPADQREHYIDQMLHDHDVGVATIWVEQPAVPGSLHYGFPADRLGINPPLVLILVAAGGALLTIIASILEVRRITKPLDALTNAAHHLARGDLPAEVPVRGPKEIAELAATFNRMSANLRRLEENRTVMIAGISHDLRTPLTRLNLAVEMLGNNGNRELIDRVRRNVEAINKLVGQFLEFSRGIETSTPVRLQLWDVVESLLLDLKPEGIDIRLNRCAAPCTYTADRNALERVLSNLLKNAVLYGNGEPVDIDLACSEHGGIIEIRDRGPGIPAGQSEAVFEPFHRLQPPGVAAAPGSGLGLAIVRQLARKHGWIVELLPRDGGGTIARIQLPPTQQSEPAPRAAA